MHSQSVDGLMMLKTILDKILDVLFGPVTTVYKRASADYGHVVGPHTFVVHTCLQVIGRKRLIPEQMNGGVMIVDVPEAFRRFVAGASESEMFVSESDLAKWANMGNISFDDFLASMPQDVRDAADRRYIELRNEYYARLSRAGIDLPKAEVSHDNALTEEEQRQLSEWEGDHPELDWEGLRQELEKNGSIRNLTLIAHMPTHAPIKPLTGAPNDILPVRKDWSK